MITDASELLAQASKTQSIDRAIVGLQIIDAAHHRFSRFCKFVGSSHSTEPAGERLLFATNKSRDVSKLLILIAERYVRAKTGTLANVSCLSGFAGSPGHVPIVFSILMNDVANAAEARRTQDHAAELLVAYLEGDAAAKP